MKNHDVLRLLMFYPESSVSLELVMPDKKSCEAPLAYACTSLGELAKRESRADLVSRQAS